MSKLVKGALVLLVVALFALPGAVGSITEARVAERVAAIDANPGVAAELRSFERGWFRSTARIDLSFVPDGVAAAANSAGTPLGVFGTLPIVVEFAHGPIALHDGVYFGWSKMVARPDAEVPGVAELTQYTGAPYLFEFRGRTGYLGSLRFDADSPPFEAPMGEALLTFSGGTLVGMLAGRELIADAQVGSVSFASPTGVFAVNGVLLSMDNELRSQYLMPGATSLSIASITAGNSVQDATPLFELKTLQFRSDVALENELLEMHATYDLESARIDDNEVTAGAIGIAVRNVDAAAVEAYGALAADAATAGDPAALATALGPHLERALKAGPSLTLDPIRFRYDGEPFDGRIEVMANPANLPPAGTLRLDNPLLLLGVVDTNAELRVSRVLAGQLATLGARMQLGADPTIPPDQLEYMAEAQSGLMLTMLVGQGVLIEDGDGYRSSIAFTDGALTLNGNPLPFGLQ
jgi:uncharacterized protein YdgA (DUF945 family)